MCLWISVAAARASPNARYALARIAWTRGVSSPHASFNLHIHLPRFEAEPENWRRRLSTFGANCRCATSRRSLLEVPGLRGVAASLRFLRRRVDGLARSERR